YPDRSSLAADGWDFLARTASGIIRDTEQISGAVVSYSESGIQVPADGGDLWEGRNTTRHSRLRDLPQNWTSGCAAVSFAPSQNTQQAGLLIYQDDDNYVQVTRVHNGGQNIVSVNESDGIATLTGSAPASAVSGIVLCIQRDLLTDAISTWYSLD